MPTVTAVTVTPGMRFRSVIADCNALWEVKSKDGRSTWLCEVVDEPIEIHGRTYPGEYAGQVKAFTTSDIQRSVQFENAWASLGARSAAWWEQQSVGTVVHYHNGHGAYVRGVIVEDKLERKMRPTALVGTWREWDLVRRFPDGTISEGYHVRKIRSGELMRPDASTMFGAPGFSAPGPRFDPGNPALLPAHPLELPAMTTQEQATAALYTLRNTALDTLRETQPDTIAEQLRQVRELLNAAPELA